MTPNNDNISKTLERSFPSASREQVESARDRIYGRLHSNSDEKPAAENFRLVPVSRWRWTVAAAAAVTFMVGIAIWMGNGERVIVLADGSRVEQLRDSELSMQEATDGIRIHLNRGGVIVTASKQQAGRHLVVQTKDVTVSVAGTTFSVNAEEGGSRVAVYEGEVRIQQGSIEKKLGAGERWRSEPSPQMASLQQPAAAPPPPRETFEEVSIRLASGPVQAGVRGGAVNVNIQGCSGGSAVEIDPRRIAMFYKNIYSVIASAYFTGGNQMQRCQYVSRLGILTGGPGWIQSDGYDIQAVIPEGSFSSRPTLSDPKLRKMLQNLLEERFRLVLSRQMKEMPVYVMTLKEPSKYASAKGAVWLTRPLIEQRPDTAQFWGTIENQEGLVAQEGTGIYGANATMGDLAMMLGRLMGQPVVDRSGFTGKFHFYVETFRDVAPLTSPLSGPRNPIEIKSIITEFEKLAGIKLELSKEKVEVLNIERIDRPAEN